jgi:hypothetical protein
MSRAVALAAAVIAVVGAAACPESGPVNPAKLWLATIGNDETRVQLVPQQPDPF